MILCELPVLLNLYTQIAPGPLFRRLQQSVGRNVHDGIYTPRLLIWMMIAERLDARGTAARSVAQLVEGRLDPLLSQCKRVRTRRISSGTGAYCQARRHLPKMLVERTMEELVHALRRTLLSRLGKGDGNVYVIDGSSIQLQDTALAGGGTRRGDGLGGATAVGAAERARGGERTGLS
jgi:phytoene dehydrogenase-like protein